MKRSGRRARGSFRTLVALVVAFGLADAAVAQMGGGPRHPPPIDRVLERHADRLGLDRDLRRSIRELSLEGRKTVRAHHDDLRALREEMRLLLEADVPDERAVLAKADEIGRVETEMQKARLRTMLAIRGLLDAEQRAELVRIHEEMREERGGPGRSRWTDVPDAPDEQE